MTQPFWVGTSWKMNKTLAEARAFAGGLPAQGDPRIRRFVIPPFTALRDVVELGHSERRAHFAETDETVGLKVAAAPRHGLIPLVCIGETLADREGGRADRVLAAEVRGALARIGADQRDAPILLAYEPVWAIGAGGTSASADHADTRQAAIIAVAGDILGRRIPCLYGGSVDPGNCADLAGCPHVDGLFIGRSAWDVAGYRDILARVGAVL